MIPEGNDSVQARQVSLAKSVSMQLLNLHGSAVVMKTITMIMLMRTEMLMTMMMIRDFIFYDGWLYNLRGC